MNNGISQKRELQGNQSSELSFFLEFLIEHKIPGVTSLRLEKLSTVYGVALINLFFNNDFQKINTVWQYDEAKINSIANRWKPIELYCRLHLALRKSGLSWPSIRKIYKKYKEKSLDYLCQDPYILLYEIGYGFRSVDMIAMELKIAKNSKIRIKAAIIATLLEKEKVGETAICKDKLREMALIFLTLDDNDSFQKIWAESLNDLIQEGKIAFYNFFYGLKKYFDAERDIFQFIQNSLQVSKEQYVNEYLSSELLGLSVEQEAAMRALLISSIGVLTGGAGTGKSTVIFSLYKILRKEVNSIIVLTPTGRASQRLVNQYPELQVMTIHKFFFENRIFFHDNYAGPFPILHYRVIIIDESSMIDSFLMATLLRCLSPKQTKIYFFGDKQQLPPVGAGSPFHSFISSRMMPIFELRQIWRQKSDSFILPLAQSVANNERFIIKNNADVAWVLATKINIKKILHNIVDTHYDEKKRILSFVGLTFLNRGISGTIALNKEISTYIHEKYGDKNEKKIIEKFYLFDIVMVCKNIYKKNLRNGQMGRVMGGNHDMISIYFQGLGIVDLEKEYAYVLELGYVINVYKSQGSEFQSLVIFLFMEQYILLNRQALYTAITRTKKNIIFVGQKKALYFASNQERSFRKQFLTLFMVFIYYYCI